MSGEATSVDDKPNFGGRYVFVRNENLNEFLVANGTSTSWTWHLIYGVVPVPPGSE